MTGRDACPGASIVPVILALGSNIGDRRAHLLRGIEFLAERIELQAVSRVVDSEPWGPVAQPRFLNLVLRGGTSLRPLDLLRVLHSAERDAGRIRIEPMGPRTLDVDLIFYGDERILRQELVVPHPRWRERPFVAGLVADVGEGMSDPVTGRPLVELAPPEGFTAGMIEVDPIVPAALGTGLVP